MQNIRQRLILLLCCAAATWCTVAEAGNVHRIARRPPPVRYASTTIPSPQAYPWGYFGAAPRRYRGDHKGYYGQFYDWGVWRMY